MRLNDLVQTSASVAATRSRGLKIDHLSELLRAAQGDEVGLVAHYLSGLLPQGRIGVGPALVHKALNVDAAAASSLELADLDRCFDEIKTISGKGANTYRQQALERLLVGATDAEQTFIARLLVGEIRQGALEGIMVEAVAKAADIPTPVVRRAWMLSGSLPEVLLTALTQGEGALRAYRLHLGRAVRPMLAQPSESLAEAFDAIENACIDVKMDGVRIQAHRDHDRIWLFTRAMHEVSRRLPEVVAQLQQVEEPRFILDGEVIALNADGSPQPFQVTMKRFGRESNVAEMAQSLPLTPVFFDLLHLSGDDTIDQPAADRFSRMASLLPQDMIMPRLIGVTATKAQSFMERVLEQGHEGIMVKRLDSTYQAGNRGSDWLKVKPVYTLDLAILAAEWGSGRRRGWLSNLHLGARAGDSEDATSKWVMLGKTFKGLSDEMLQWQTDKLLELETSREGHIVHVQPELIVEVAFNEVQRSSNYASGMALRFARVKRYRKDKTPEDADTAAAVAALMRK